MSFKKPLHNLKTSAPLRSSDARKLTKEICDVYNFPEDQDRSLLVPDGIQAAKFVTHIEEHGTLYTSDDQPLWIRLGKGKDDSVVPTVYSLWKFPFLLPTLTTWMPVIEKLMGGADLMIPGVVLPPGGLSVLKTGQVVAIVAHGSATPLAIGTLAVPSPDIKTKQTHGKAVHIIHTIGDALFEMGDKSDPPVISPQARDQLQQNMEATVDQVGQEIESIHIGFSESTLEPTETVNAKANGYDKAEEISPEEIDEILTRAALFALHKLGPSPESFPIPASQFYSAHVLPSRPASHGSDIDIKKSSFKKVQKFLKAMEKSGYVKVKEIKGDLVVMSADWNKVAIKDFKPYKAVGDLGSVASAGKSPSSQSSISIKDCWKPHAKSLAVFQDQKKSTNDLYSALDLREILFQYVKEHDLVDPKRPKMVKIDAILCDALLAKEEYHSVDFLGRDQLVGRFVERMLQYHTLEGPGYQPVVRKGAAQPIHVIIEQRQGRKTVTRILGLEAFGLSAEAIGEELRKVCASSTAVTALPNSTPKHPAFEVLVQGPQLKAVADMMLARGVPKKCIQVMDKTKNK